MLPDLDVVRVELGGGLEEQLPDRLGGATALVVRIEEPLPDELELEVLEAVGVEQRLDVGECPRLEDVLQVGMPEADSLEPDALGVRAALGEVEQAPLAARVDLHRARRRPVERDKVVVRHVAENVTGRRALRHVGGSEGCG